MEDEERDARLAVVAHLEPDVRVEEAVAHVEVAHLLDEVVRRAVRLLVELEDLVERRLVEVVVSSNRVS